MLFLLVPIFSLLYYFYGWPYAKGMTEYVRLNNNGLIGCENTWHCIRDEYRELVDAIQSRKFLEAFFELFDVLHGTTKSFIVTLLPRKIYYHWLCWIIVFPFLMPATIKLGYRYNKYKCIRNHSRSNRNHKCVINKYIL